MEENISANDLKTRGATILEERLSRQEEAIITLRGQKKYVVMTMEHYNYLRECELEAALQDARMERETGNYKTDSIEDHISRITNA